MLTVETTNDPGPEVLLCQARAGDCQALGHLITHYRPRIFRMLLARIDRQTAEDVIQETDLAVVACLPGFKGTTANDFFRWYGGIAFKKRGDALRRKYRDRDRQQDHEGLVSPPFSTVEEGPAPSPLDVEDDGQHASIDIVINVEQAMRLRSLLARLDPIDRFIVVRRAIDAERLRVIAQEVSLSISTVAERYRKALAKLESWAGVMGLDPT
jgi:RNA polymerase sigma factor (sigma-70 family)